MIEVAILSVGDQPEGLAAVRRLLASKFSEVANESVPDEQALIKKPMRLWADKGIALVLTIGGIGVGLRERTPEATVELIERDIPGLAELARLAGVQKTRLAALTRGQAGIRGKTLIVNLPALDTDIALEAILPLLVIAVQNLRGS
jgi:molybdopterin adenylyltransferase